MDAIDKAIFVGDSGANEAGADITGLNTAAISETTLTQASKIAGAETLQVFLAWVDGILCQHDRGPERCHGRRR